MIVFMLHNSCSLSRKGFRMFDKILIKIFNSNFPGSFYLLRKSRNAQAAFIILPCFFRCSDDPCIDESLSDSFVIFPEI